MKRTICAVILVGMIVSCSGNTAAIAGEMKKIVIVSSPVDAIRDLMIQNTIACLAKAGFRQGETADITVVHPTSSQEGGERVKALQPDVLIEIGLTNRVVSLFSGTSLPVVSIYGIEEYVDEEGNPTGNVTGVYSTLKDMVYNSYKFLKKVVPLKPGQKAVFLENTTLNLVPREQVIDALQRLDIPLKTIINTTVYEDWQEAILQYNDDPNIGWVLMGIWPTRKRYGSVVNWETDTAVWQREHLKKPMVTYWEVAVKWGILCGFAIDLDELGLQSGEMAARVLKSAFYSHLIPNARQLSIRMYPGLLMPKESQQEA